MIFFRNKKIIRFIKCLCIVISLIFVVGCRNNLSIVQDKVSINIISTSDVHGKLLPYDYVLNKEDKSGSLAQISKAIKEIGKENTLLIDLGDIVYGNSSDFFLNDEVSPLIYAQNLMNYDVYVLGNHEFDYGMNATRKIINTHEGDVLCANVFYENGECIAKPYAIREIAGVKIGIIGIVTSDIMNTNADYLKEENIIVKDPIEEVKKIAKEIRNDVDLLIAACHIGLNIHYAGSDIDVANIAMNVPEVDLILAAHTHIKIESEYRNNILITENQDGGKTLSYINIDMIKNDNKYKVKNIKSKSYDIKDYEEDTYISENEKILEANKRIKEYVSSPIARLKNKNLTDDNAHNEIPIARLRDTSLTRFVNEALMHYADAEIAAAPLHNAKSNLYEGNIKRSDMYKFYLYDDYLYKLNMTGRQLKKWMEQVSTYFNTYKDGDSDISANKNFSSNFYYIFGGIKYNIDITKEVGDRITNLTLLNGEKIEMDKYYTVATNDFVANSRLLKPNAIFDEEDGLPILLEKEICTDIGGNRELIYDYIINVKGIKAADGIVDLEVTDVTEENANWKVMW